MGDLLHRVRLNNTMADIRVEKNFDPEYLDGQKTFRDLIDYALMPESDKFNPEGYSQEERRNAARIEDWMETGVAYVLSADTNENPPQKKELQLNSAVADHAEGLFKESFAKHPVSGEKVPCKVLDIYLSGASSAGLALEYRL